MCKRELPYEGIAPYQVVIGVATKGLRPPLDDTLPPSYKEMMTSCWDDLPSTRPSFVSLTERLEKLVCPEPVSKKPQKRKNARRVAVEERVISTLLDSSEDDKSLS